MKAGRRFVPMAAAGTGLLAMTAIAARGVPAWERHAYRAVNGLPDTLAPLAWAPMQFGSLTSPFVIAGLVFSRNRRPQPAASLIAAGFAAWIMAKGVKKIVGRGRPYDHDPRTRLRLGTETDGSLGFVSGHAAVATACAGIIRRHTSPSVGVAACLLAGVVGLCRIYAGAHLPIDVAGGVALGVVVSEGVATLMGPAAGTGPAIR